MSSKKEKILSTYEIKRLLEFHGVDQSTAEAREYAVEKLEEIGKEIVRLAVEVKNANKRSTLSAKDIEAVIRD